MATNDRCVTIQPTFSIKEGEAELAKLREPLAAFNPSYWVLGYGFRKPAN